MLPLKIAVVSTVPTDPPNAGNRARILEMIQSLTGQGHEIYFLFADYEEGDIPAMRARFGERFTFVQTGKAPAMRAFWSRAWRYLARRLGWAAAFSWAVDDWFDPRIATAARELVVARKIDTVLCQYVFTSAVADAVRGTAHSVIDCHDLFGDRHLRYLRSGLRPAWFSTSIAAETRALGRADAVIAIEESEAVDLRERGLPHVHCVGPLVAVPAAPLDDPARPSLLFVGSQNPINVAALTRFVEKVWPQVHVAVPDAELLIAGKCGAASAWPAGVRALGELPTIEAAYRKGAVAINPVEFGTGFCIKTMEAFGFGRPLVTTPSGARGLDLATVPFLRVAATDEEFAGHCIDLLRDAEKRGQLGAEARRFAEQWNLDQLRTLDRALRPASPGQRG